LQRFGSVVHRDVQVFTFICNVAFQERSSSSRWFVCLFVSLTTSCSSVVLSTIWKCGSPFCLFVVRFSLQPCHTLHKRARNTSRLLSFFAHVFLERKHACFVRGCRSGDPPEMCSVTRPELCCPASWLPPALLPPFLTTCVLSFTFSCTFGVLRVLHSFDHHFVHSCMRWKWK